MNEIQLVNDFGLRRLSGALEASADKIMEFEEKLGKHLPDDYTYFLEKFSACIFSEDVVFTLIEKSPWSKEGIQWLDHFYGFSEKSGHDLRKVNARLTGDIPEETIAIGHDAGSNLILLSLKDDTFGYVLFFDRDSARSFLIAESFTNFLNSFRRG